MEGQRRKTILVIDDEVGILEEMKLWLEEYGYNVVTASNGMAGLEKLNEITPHLIILDILMPRMDGFEVLLKLKDDFKTSSIPVIMLTAKRETGSIFKAQEMRATDYILKPFVPEELLRLIRIHEN